MNEYTSLIDIVVVAGAAVVLPVALGRWSAAWAAVATSTALALSTGTGPLAALLALPWLAVAGAATAAALRDVPQRRRSSLDRVAAVAAPAFAVVAGVGLLASCAGAALVGFGFGEPITRLAVVHFTFAGTATTALGRAAMAADGPTWRRRVATVGTVVAMGAPPVVALGFWSDRAVPQVGGAVLMSVAAYLLAVSHLAEGRPARATTPGRLLLVSGLSVWLPMVLAVTWALAQHTGGWALSIPDMARIHGSLNAVGFVGCGLGARWLLAHEHRPVAPAAVGLAPGVGR